MNNFVNIGIVTFNRLEYTRKCIESVLEHTDYPYTISVIDNGSDDGTKEFLTDLKAKGYIKKLFLLNENIGVAKASNIAWLSEPEAGYYLKLDNDVIILKSPWLTPMTDAIERFSVAGAVAYNFEKITYPSQTINGYPARIKHGNLGGACILIPKRTEKLLGYWCEDYGLYGQEDLDYGIRIQLAGLLNIYMDDDCAALHLDSGDDLEYVAWKKEHFEKSNNYEKIANNVYGFFKGTRPLYYRPAFAEAYVSIDNSTAANDIQDSQNRMFLLANSRNYNGAVKEAETLLQKYPGFAFLHNFLSSIYNIMGDTVRAGYHHEQAGAINPFIHEVPPNLADFYKQTMKN